jgi:hypothetical protein
MGIICGWTVRVTTTHLVQGLGANILYAAGFSLPTEAEDAVREGRSSPGERYRALKPISDVNCPKVGLGKIREL